MTLTLTALMALAVFWLPSRVQIPVAVRSEAAVVLGTRAELNVQAERVKGLRWGPTLGDQMLLPAPPDRATKQRIGAIFHRAARYQRRAATPEARAQYGRLVRAAAVSEPYLPRAIRERTRTRSGREVLWVLGACATDGSKVPVSARAARSNGQSQLWRLSLWAGCVAFACAGIVAVVSLRSRAHNRTNEGANDGARVVPLLVAAWLAVALGLVFLGGLKSTAPVLPIGVAAACAVVLERSCAYAIVAGAGSAWFMAPWLYGPAAGALLVIALAAWIFSWWVARQPDPPNATEVV